MTAPASTRISKAGRALLEIRARAVRLASVYAKSNPTAIAVRLSQEDYKILRATSATDLRAAGFEVEGGAHSLDDGKPAPVQYFVIVFETLRYELIH